MTRSGTVVRFTVAATVAGALIASTASAAGPTSVGVDAFGFAFDKEPVVRDMSADGRFALFDTDHALGMSYLRDRVRGTTADVRIDAAGGALYGPAAAGRALAVSDDGRRVLFRSTARAAPSDGDDGEDLFLRDLAAGTTEQVNLGSAGRQDGTPSVGEAALSGDGRTVAFSSTTSGLVDGVANAAGRRLLYVRDLPSATTTLLARGAGGAEPDGTVELPYLNRDGRFVTFSSRATNLLPAAAASGVAPGSTYLQDRSTGELRLISAASGSTQAAAGIPRGVSDDGRRVLFASNANGLVAGDQAGGYDLFVREGADTTAITTTPSGGVVTDAVTTIGAISGDGRSVAFASASGQLGPPPTGVAQVLVRDLESGDLRTISVSGAGQFANAESGAIAGRDGVLAIGVHGRHVLFASRATNLRDLAPDPLPGGASRLFLADSGVNQRPTARLSVSVADQTVTLDGGDSSDDDGAIVSGRIAIDGTWRPGLRVATRLDPGTHGVTLEVTDDDGDVSTSVAAVVVGAPPPAGQDPPPGGGTVPGGDEAPDPGGSAPVPVPPAVRPAPRLSRLTVGPRSPRIPARGRRLATVSLTADVAARVTITVSRIRRCTGRGARRRCPAPARVGTLRMTTRVGTTKQALPVRIAGARLVPGRYRLQAVLPGSTTKPTLVLRVRPRA